MKRFLTFSEESRKFRDVDDFIWGKWRPQKVGGGIEGGHKILYNFADGCWWFLGRGVFFILCGRLHLRTENLFLQRISSLLTIVCHYTASILKLLLQLLCSSIMESAWLKSVGFTVSFIKLKKTFNIVCISKKNSNTSVC